MRDHVPSSRAIHPVDVALGVWVAIWIGLSVAIGLKLSDLSALSHTAVVDGQAVQTLGKALGVLGAIPFVGGSFAGVANQVQLAGASAVHGGTSSLSSIHALSVLLPITVAVLPSLPVLGLYLPMRIKLRREARALHSAVLAHGDDPGFRAFLARRAVGSLAYDRLECLVVRPWEQRLSEADRDELAAVELRRLGIDPALLARRSAEPPATRFAEPPAT